MSPHPDGPTRREFLGHAAAAASAPYVITSSALGAGDRPAASERITTCMIGIGSRGRMVLGHFLGDSRAQCLAVCDVDSLRRAHAKRMVDQKNRNADCAEYGDFRELLNRADIDAVATATPDFWHVPIAAWACKQGKDVYCEKPPSSVISAISHSGSAGHFDGIPQGRSLSETKKQTAGSLVLIASIQRP